MLGDNDGLVVEGLAQLRVEPCATREVLAIGVRWAQPLEPCSAERMRRKSFRALAADARATSGSPVSSKSVHRVHPRKRTPLMTTSSFSST